MTCTVFLSKYVDIILISVFTKLLAVIIKISHNFIHPVECSYIASAKHNFHSNKYILRLLKLATENIKRTQ